MTSDGKIIQFPGSRQQPTRPEPGSTLIPFSSLELRAVAEHLCAAEPEIFTEAVLATGGSLAIVAFFDYLWGLVGVVGAIVLVCLAWAQPSWAQAQPSQQSALDLAKSLLADEAKDKAEQLAAFTAAEAEIQQLEERSDEALRADPRSTISDPNSQWVIPLWEAMQPRRIAQEYETKHPTEVAQSITAWKPALSTTWGTCVKHMEPLLQRGQTMGQAHFEPLFQASCPAIEVQYNRAKEVVGYVLARRAAAEDLATISRAAGR